MADTIDVNMLRPIGPQSYDDTTPAIRALEQAFKKGMLNYDDLVSHLTQFGDIRKKQTLNTEDIKSSQSRQSLLPAQTALAADEIKARRDIVGPGTQLTLDQIKSRRATTPYETDFNIAHNKLGTAQAGAETEILPAKTRAAKATAELEAGWSESLLKNPMLYGQMKLMASPIWKEVFDAAEKTGRTDILAAGLKGGKDPATIMGELGSAPNKMDAKDVAANAAAVTDIDNSIADIAKAREIITDTKTTPVGPGISQGSLPAQGITKAKAFIGMDPTKFDQQQRLTKTLAGGILTSIQGLRGLGQIRNVEIEWLEKHQPDLSSTPEFWTDWLNRSQKVLEQGKAVKIQTLPSSVTKTVTASDSIKAGDMAPTNAPAAKDPRAGLPVIMTQEEADKLPKGTRAVDSQGNIFIKR